MRGIIDTDICIHLIRGKRLELLSRFQEYEPGELCVSIITVAELAYGSAKSERPQDNRRAVEEFLLPLTVAEFDYECASRYGEIRALLEKAGTTIGPLDTFIAAQALRLGIPLITGNRREFSRVPGLTVENWLREQN